jgi:hypothetical protein
MLGQAWRDFRYWWRNLDKRDKFELSLQGCIVALTLGFLVVTWWQLKEIREGSKDTKAIAEAAKQQAENTKILAEAAKNQAQAALEQAKAAKIQADASSAAAKSSAISAKAAQMGVETTKSGIHIANRAYVSVDKMRFLNPLEANKPVVLIFEFVNDGNSAAEINGTGGHFFHTTNLSKCRYGEPVFRKIMVSPKSPRTQKVDISPKGFTQSQFEDIQQSRSYLHVCIKITYTTLNENYPFENCSYYSSEMRTFLECKRS